MDAPPKWNGRHGSSVRGPAPRFQCLHLCPTESQALPPPSQERKQVSHHQRIDSNARGAQAAHGRVEWQRLSVPFDACDPSKDLVCTNPGLVRPPAIPFRQEDMSAPTGTPPQDSMADESPLGLVHQQIAGGDLASCHPGDQQPGTVVEKWGHAFAPEG
jgi:hypothetical protein